MEPIQAFFGIDWKTFCITLFTALVGFQVIVQLLNWFLFDFLGIETKAMREKKEEHKLLLDTVNGLKDLSEKHTEDVKQSIKHDKEIQNNLNICMEEIRTSLSETQSSIQQFTENRIHDRAQSISIQKELTSNITKLTNSDKVRDNQIQNIILTQKETLGDRINQKYKYYLSINGIPEDEVDEFISLHAAYKLCGGNHSGDAKFNYCMEHLPHIPVDVKLKFDE